MRCYWPRQGPIYGKPEGSLDALIWGDGLENVTITGGGVIEGKTGITRDREPAGVGRRIVGLQRCKKRTNHKRGTTPWRRLHAVAFEHRRARTGKYESREFLEPRSGRRRRRQRRRKSGRMPQRPRL